MLLLAILVGLLAWSGSRQGDLASDKKPSGAGPGDKRGGELTLYCAAGLRVPIEEMAAAYEAEFATSIRLQYGGSNTLLSQIEVARTGDLFLAADESYLAMGKEKRLVDQIVPLSAMEAVLVVARGNPKKIHGLDDLLRDDVRAALANPDQAALGKATRDCLASLGRWEAMHERIVEGGVFKPTVADVANDVALGTVDVGVVWDAVASQRSDLQTVRVPELSAARGLVALGTLRFARDPAAALHFARFAADRDRGLPILERHGYRLLGDVSHSEVGE